MVVFDISVPIRDGMVVYPGNPPVRVERVMSLADGDVCNLSCLRLGSHTGTHVDAPVHFIDGASGVDSTPLDVLIGPAYVVDATNVTGPLDAETIATLEIPDGVSRLLFKTRNSLAWTRPEFDPDYVALTPDSARLLVQRGIRLVGLDYLSIGSGQENAATHRAVLGAGVVIVEGLDLSVVPAGWYRLVCLPLRLVGGDAAPARAVLESG